MNKEIKDKWIRALRTGDYKHGINFLKDKELCCRLGVLYDIVEKQNVGEWIVYGGTYNDVFLAVLNDSGRTFNEIADIIENKL